MDRFVMRTSTASWRSIDTTFMRSFANKSFTDKISTPKTETVKNRRLSIRDETLIRIFSSQADQPLNDENLNPAEVFKSASQPSPKSANTSFDYEPPKINKNLGVNVLGASCQPVADRTAHESPDARNLEVMPMTPPTDLVPSSAENVFAQDKALHNRLQRDLNSPSATARLRAMKALRSPTKTAYTNFDVPHEEQDIITAEERNRCPESIQEVMKDVVVYVEVRTGEDNRSAGVKNVISRLGAKVNDRFLRDTTHVVFKDGLLSTYKKAKKWNIPIVSILWIEACKKHMVLMKPEQFPISNLERYENPEMYTKLKRQKSMQPNAEDNVRRHKVKMMSSSSKEKTEKEVEIVKSAKKISIPRKPKDKLGEIFQEFQEKLMSTPEFTDDIMKPNSKVLERLQNSPYSAVISKSNQKSKIDSKVQNALLSTLNENEDSDDDFETPKNSQKTPEINARRSLLFDKSQSSFGMKKPSTLSAAAKRRTTIMPQLKSPKQSSITSFLSKSTKESANVSETSASQKLVQSARKSRRSSISSVTKTPRTKVGSAASIEKTVILEESCDIDEVQNERAGDSHSNTDGQKTTLSNIELDTTKPTVNNNTITPNLEANRRRTVFTHVSMEQTNLLVEKTLDKPISASVHRTGFNFDTSQCSFTNDNQATEAAQKTIVHEQPLQISDNCPPSIRKSVRRRTIFTPRFHDETSNNANDVSLSRAAAAIKPISLFQTETPTQKPASNDDCPTSIKKSARRRTMFTPSCYEKNSRNAEDVTNTSTAAITKPVSSFDSEELTPKPGTVLDELNSSMSFSSSKTPARRRTIFDISMDIIGQRLQNINKSAKQSRYSEYQAKDDLADDKPSNDLPAPMSTIDEIVANPAVDTDSQNGNNTTAGAFTAALNSDSFKTSTKIMGDTLAVTTPSMPKKRKLFAPTELLFSTPPATSGGVVDTNAPNVLDGNLKKKAKTDVKPVKTIKRINGVDKKGKGAVASTISRAQSRRSTLDFEQVERFRTMKNLQQTKPQTTDNKLNYIVCTNMHTEQLNFIKQAIKKLGGFKLETTVNVNTTHVVSLEPRRTFNLLRGIVHGLWILTYDWVVESIECGQWVFEEPYELTNFSRGVEICRSQRQAFGRNFKMDLFVDLSPIYISPESNVPPENLQELIELCSGQVVEDKKLAKYVLGESLRENPEKICLNPIWILDSIQDNQIKKVTKYIIAVR